MCATIAPDERYLGHVPNYCLKSDGKGTALALRGDGQRRLYLIIYTFKDDISMNIYYKKQPAYSQEVDVSVTLRNNMF